MRSKTTSHGLKASLLILSCAVLFGTASASWNNLKSVEGKSASVDNDSLVAVCYITNSSGTKYYTDLTKALQVANTNGVADQIYVIPGLANNSNYSGFKFTEAVISENCTVASGDELILPYEDTAYYSIKSSGNFGDVDLNVMKSNWVTDVVISAGKTLTINGKVTIGGEMFSTGINLQGQTSGRYSQISLSSNSKIVVSSGGTLDIYGYIKEFNEGSSIGALVTVESGGTINTPLVFYDFKGGSETLTIYTAGADISGGLMGAIEAVQYLRNTKDNPDAPGVFPINIFDFPNIQVKLRINRGGVWTCFSDFYANNTHNTITGLELASTSSTSVFTVSGGSSDYFTADYTPKSTAFISSDRKVALTVTDYSLSKDNKAITYWDFHCNATFNNMTMYDAVAIISDLSVSVSTMGKFLPFSYKFDITFSSGTITSAADIKFLYGSKVHIKEGAELIANSSVIVYDSTMTVNNVASTAWADKVDTRPYPSQATLGDALFINDGTFTVNSSFGGRIRTTNSDGSAKISFATGASYSTTSNEFSGDTNDIDVSSIISGIPVISFGVDMDVVNVADASIAGAVTTLSESNYNSTDVVAETIDGVNYYEWEVYVSPYRQVTINYPYSEYTSALGVTFSFTIGGQTYTQDSFNSETTAYTFTDVFQYGETISISGISNVASVTRGTNVTSSPSSYSYTILETDGNISIEIIPMTILTLDYTSYANMNTSSSSLWTEWREANLYVTIKAVGPEHTNLSFSLDYSKYSSLQSDSEFYEVANTRTTSNVTNGESVVGTEMKVTFYAKGYGTSSRNYTDFKITATTTTFNRLLTLRMYSRDGGSTITETLGSQGRN